MLFHPPLLSGRLIKRYKRFLADIVLDSGENITAHCPNSGSLKHNNAEGLTVWVQKSSNPKRKLPYTWELARSEAGDWVMIHAARANALTREAIEAGRIKELSGFDKIESEVKYGHQKSRIDLLLHFGDQRCFVEVKSVTLLENGVLMFPDAVTTRGQKHLEELIAMRAEGHRAMIFFAALHTGSDRFTPAEHIDPRYAGLLRQAAQAGVEILAYRAEIAPEGATLKHPMQVTL